jgi:carbonic anhydrase
MTRIEEHLRRVAVHPGRYAQPDTPAQPAQQLAVITCMDCRIDLFDLMGLYVGDAHVLRNAGGIVTDDVERSLVLSQHLLGTRKIIVLQHTRCGLLGASDEDIDQLLEERTGQRPPWRHRTFTDLEGSVRLSMKRLRDSPFVDTDGSVRGLIYDVDSGELRRVEPEPD